MDSGGGSDHRLRAGQDRGKQLPRTRGPNSVVLFSRWLDASSRIRVEQEKRKLKRRRSVFAEQKVVCEIPPASGSSSLSELHAKPTTGGWGNQVTLESASLAQVKSRLSVLIGQTIPGL